MSGGGAQNPKKKQEKFKIDKKTPPRRGQLEAQKERKQLERWRARISEKQGPVSPVFIMHMHKSR